MPLQSADMNRDKIYRFLAIRSGKMHLEHATNREQQITRIWLVFLCQFENSNDVITIH